MWAKKWYRVFRKNCVFSQFTATPSSTTYIAVRDLQSSQRYENFRINCTNLEGIGHVDRQVQEPSAGVEPGAESVGRGQSDK